MEALKFIISIGVIIEDSIYAIAGSIGASGERCEAASGKNRASLKIKWGTQNPSRNTSEPTQPNSAQVQYWIYHSGSRDNNRIPKQEEPKDTRPPSLKKKEDRPAWNCGKVAKPDKGIYRCSQYIIQHLLPLKGKPRRQALLVPHPETRTERTPLKGTRQRRKSQFSIFPSKGRQSPRRLWEVKSSMSRVAQRRTLTWRTKLR